MDYNDNDYEGQNLHLAGEDSSKVSSVLRPFALPKFDFDDSLHGHLRFDSLVENEVFLGIPSQEDNQWIEDFSRGSSGIEFSSSATESCALPRHNNVWSEATSSESVEMLLKAVGQEEMVPGENVVEESEPVDQLGCSTKQMEVNLKEGDQMDDVDDENPSSLAPEVEGKFSMLNKTPGVEGVYTECTLQAQETKLSSYGVSDGQECSLIVTSENLHTDMKSTSDNQGHLSVLVNESLSKQVQKNLPVPDVGIEKSESSSQMITISVQETGHQDKVSDFSFVSSSCMVEGISEGINEQKEGCNTSDERVGGSDDETVSLKMHCPLEILARSKSSEDQEVEDHVTTTGEASSIPGKGESGSSFEGFNEVAFVVESAGGSESGTLVFSSGKEIKRLPEGCNTLPEKSSVSIQEERCVEGIVMKGSHADGLDNLMNSSFAGECCMEKTVIEHTRDATDAPITQKKSSEDGDNVSPPLLAGITQTCREDALSVEADVHECKMAAFACEKEDEKLPLDSTTTVCDDNEKEAGSTFSGQVVNVNVETAIGSQPNASVGGYTVLNSEVEDIKLTSTPVKGDDLAACHEHGAPSYDMGNGDQIDFEANKEINTSISKEPLEVADEFAPVTETGEGILPDSATTRGTKTVDQSPFSMETSSAAMHDELSKKLNENFEHPSCDVIVQDDVAEATPSGKSKEAELEITREANSSIVPATTCAVEIDELNKLSSPGASCNELSQSKLSTSLENSDAKDVGNILSTSINSGANLLSKDEGTFTFDTRHLGSQSTGDSSLGLQSISSFQACKSSKHPCHEFWPKAGEGSASTSGNNMIDSIIVKGIPHGSSLMPDGKPPPGGLKGSAERKSRRGSSKSGKDSAKKGNQEKDPTHLRQSVRGDKSYVPSSPLGAGQVMTFESFVRPRGAVSIPTSSLPDLNTSAPPSAFFQQPFTDVQQVQLRAQIFVYGSLIQGVAPDEACMVSAFGMSDGGRSIWEPSWRAVVERLHGQKSQGINSETPVQARSGVKVSDQVSRQTFPKSEVLSSPAGRANNKSIPSPVVNPMIPLSSPLWNISTPSCESLTSSSMARCAVFDYQAVSPLHPYQTPPIRNLVAHTTSWPSQTTFPVPWLASSQSSPFDISTNYAAFPILEPVKLATPVKESSMPISSGSKHQSSVPAVHSGATPIPPGTSSLVDLKKVTVSIAQTSGNTKARKRKKSSVAEDVLQISGTTPPADAIFAPVVANHLSKKASAVEDLSQISLLARNQADCTSTPVVSSHYSTSITVTAPSSFVPKGTSHQFFSAALPSMSSDHLKSGDSSTDRRTLNLEEFSKVEEAKLQAEEASVHAAAAARHCQDMWNQLEQQKNSGLTSDAEAKLASAAVAIAAAASVAKAAAAAAKIASSAAVQAKQMADEAVTKYGTVNTPEYNTFAVSNSVGNLANATPVSILKGGDRNNASSFLAISAAREAARKRVEAASAATRHAENLDAIVKAAELAAEAVSHAGKIVSMSDPFPLSELVQAGPDGYWKVSQVASVPVSKSNGMNNNKPDNSNVGEGSAKDMGTTSRVMLPVQREFSRNTVDVPILVEESLVASVRHGAKNSKAHKDKRVSDSDKTSGIVSEPHNESRSNSSTPSNYESTAIIKEGSLVEVLKDHGDFKKAWFSANVLSLKDGEALVCYTELQSDQGSERLKEWVSLGAKDGNPAIVRIPHPMTAVQFEGTRKRRRAAMKDYAWSVGDKVDAWVQDCWREGIIAENNKKDTTTLSVHFPAQGETLAVKVWHLRPTLIWVDGRWIEWCKPRLDRISQGDTPTEKRPKLGVASFEAKGKGKMSKNIDFAEMGKNEEPRLPLSANEKAFNIGSTRDGNEPNVGRTMRSGLQKEGSRVVFGVPKPGKKRKFMEVSKHYVSDGITKTNVPNDSVKLAQFLLPQGSGSRGWKNNSKIDSKEKQAAEAKLKALRPGKPPTNPRRKDDSTSSRPNAGDATLSEVKGSISNDDELGEPNLTEFGSFSNVSESAMVFSSQALPTENRKKTTVNTKSERLNRGKLAPVSGKSAKSEANENLSDVTEPRRSNRRIQPTSRLLEGLQSSLTISKLPSSSHDKSHRNHSKGASRGSNNRG